MGKKKSMKRITKVARILTSVPSNIADAITEKFFIGREIEHYLQHDYRWKKPGQVDDPAVLPEEPGGEISIDHGVDEAGTGLDGRRVWMDKNGDSKDGQFIAGMPEHVDMPSWYHDNALVSDMCANFLKTGLPYFGHFELFTPECDSEDYIFVEDARLFGATDSELVFDTFGTLESKDVDTGIADAFKRCNVRLDEQRRVGREYRAKRNEELLAHYKSLPIRHE